MTEGISNKCWDTIKELISSYQQPGQKSEEEEEDSAMAALMRSTGEDRGKLQTCQRYHSKPGSKRETILRFEKLFEQ